jgi:protein-S-isoprenylcysteine O-methyltransferase Ste14
MLATLQMCIHLWSNTMIDQETVIRILLVMGFVVVSIVVRFYKARADNGEILNGAAEGWLILLGLRLSVLAAFLGLIAWIFDPHLMSEMSIEIPIAVRWTGIALLSFSALLKVWTFQTLGNNYSISVETRHEHQLITTGPFHWVRHPSYSSFGLDLIAINLITSNCYIIVTSLVAFTFLYLRTRIEERNLDTKFKDQYSVYRQKTGQFLPKF